LPAVHVAGYRHCQLCKPVGVKIVIAISAKVPLWCKTKAVVEINTGRKIGFKPFNPLIKAFIKVQRE
jgi:hypothetical protein